ncbi:putative membrane protein [Catalinimonas alkaloidigena]|uniref:MerC domain-containing protein n=1 Tax=Catalinimonas alkaloidigena TaxID=1075417 RepID=UPI00240652E7|nr:MerC domain-containing protein [Catalinimonas alkaloidigena]MDF9796005.1 putative membrane protein [Catalinimonas alkaloidigena]
MFLADTKADTIGILGSIFCLIHCLIFPVLVMGGMLNEEWSSHAEWVDFIFIILAISAVFFAARQSKNNTLKGLMWFSVAWFSASILLHETFNLALYSSMAASVVLVVLHSINFKNHQQRFHTKNATA